MRPASSIERWASRDDSDACVQRRGHAFAIKSEVDDPATEVFAFPDQKTMYGGKRIAKGDIVFVFASENEGGSGLVAKGVVVSAKASPKRPGLERQTPRVSVAIDRTAVAKRSLGRREPRQFSTRNDGRPETDLNFKSVNREPIVQTLLGGLSPSRAV